MPAGMSVGMVALAGCALMAAACAVLRRAAAFTIVSVAAIVASIAVCATDPSAATAACVLAVAGQVACWAGLLLVRAMLVRSVSLTMLIAAASGGAAEVDGLMAGRLEEAETYRLATCRGNRFDLTSAGRMIVRLVGAADRALGRAR